MIPISSRRLALLVLLLLPLPAWSQDTPEPNAEGIVDAITAALNAEYIFADVAREMDDHLHARLAEGAYDRLSLPDLTEKLTDDLREISSDLHLSVRPLPPRDLDEEQRVDEAAMRERYLAHARRSNFGFRKVEILPGGVGLLDLRGFADAEVAGATAVAAMGTLGNSDALIVDLRQNGGGSPSMIQLITSYFFEEPQHLNSFEIRRDDSIQQYWTQAHVEGRKMVDIPIWILTSANTFSAAEEFTYNLKNMERATIVGDTTGGGAHPVDTSFFPALGVQMSLPFGRAVNPITGTNWEGTGVTPHVPVAASEALDTAYRLALETLLEASSGDDDRERQIRWALEGVRGRIEPMTLAPEELEAYVGSYAPRRIWLEDGRLRYQRADGPIATLSPLDRDLFTVDLYDDFRIRFERDAQGAVSTLVGLSEGGRESPSPRSGSNP